MRGTAVRDWKRSDACSRQPLLRQNAGGDGRTITVTSLTPTRVKGTFSGTLQPQPGKPATTPLVITDGVFDVGIP